MSNYTENSCLKNKGCMNMNELLQEAFPILQKIEDAGYEAVFVGGSVRDFLLQKPIHDVDIATSAKPEVIQQLFEKTIPVGIEHGTVLVRFNNRSYEVTTYRMDGEYKDYRHPEEVHFVTKLEEDLARRDFTINAIAMTKTGEIIDPFNGQLDLRNKTIRTVNDPNQRFQEDPLRMMRALRFYSQLGFEIEKRTKQAMAANRELLSKIAVERIAVEMEKLLLGKYVSKTLNIFLETGIHQYLPNGKRLASLYEQAFRKVKLPFHSIAEWISFMHLLDSTIPIDSWCKQWKLSRQVRNDAIQFRDAFHVFQKSLQLSLTLYLLNKEKIPAFVHLVNTLKGERILKELELQENYERLPIHSKKDIKIDGNEMLRLQPDIKPGPWLTEIFKQLEMEILLGRLKNNKEAIKNWVLQWIREKN